MHERVETWAMAVLLLCACVLLVGALLEQEWLGGAVWAIAIALTANGLRRQISHRT